MAERLQLHWSNLAAEDAAHAYDTVLALAEMPGLCVPFLAEQVKPVQPVSNEQIAKWIGDLDDGLFKVRDEASANLAAVRRAGPSCAEKGRQWYPSLEICRRIEKIVDRLDAMYHSPTLLRELRSVEVLQRIGSDGAAVI